MSAVTKYCNRKHAWLMVTSTRETYCDFLLSLLLMTCSKIVIWNQLLGQMLGMLVHCAHCSHQNQS